MMAVIITADTNCLLCAPHSSKHFKWITPFYPDDSMDQLHVTDEETEAQRG